MSSATLGIIGLERVMIVGDDSLTPRQSSYLRVIYLGISFSLRNEIITHYYTEEVYQIGLST
jgi:hypothetical protein